MFQFTPESGEGHRIRVQGTVTFQHYPSEMFIAGANGSIHIATSAAVHVKPGERVDVVGFPSRGDNSPMLEDAIFKPVGQGRQILPARLNARDCLYRNHDSELVEVKGTFQRSSSAGGYRYWILASGGVDFDVWLDRESKGQAWPSVRPGASVLVTGVSSVKLDSNGGPESLWILLRTPRDAQIISQPSWWTARRALLVAALFALLILGGIFWVWELRRRVHSQTGIILERLQHEVALEERYRDLFENANDMVFTTDLTGRFTSLNKKGEEISGYSRSEALNMSLTEFASASSLGAVSEAVERLLGGGQVARFEMEVMARDGRHVPLELSARLIYENGGATGIHAVGRDVTERKRAEASLERANRILRTLGKCKEAIVEARSESQLLDSVCNAITETAGYRMCWVGYAREDHQVEPMARAGYEDGYTGLQCLRWDESEAGNGPTGKAIRTGRITAVRDFSTDPSVAPWRDQAIKRGYSSSVALPLLRHHKPFGALNIYSSAPAAFDEEEIHSLKDLADNLSYGILALRTRQERRRAVESLRESEELFKGAFQYSNTGMTLLGLDGAFLQVNPVLCSMLGFREDELLSRNFQSVIHPEDAGDAQAQLDCLRSGGADQAMLQTRLRHKTSRVVWAEVRISPIRGADAKPIRFISQIQDVTERKRAEEALRESEERFRSVFENATVGFYRTTP
ncbi:MAG: PAS domain S-box protein, partial [Acidobacteriota bacterium]|nr:PAS domain S-box protein [Acidobacteriota bacterium]